MTLLSSTQGILLIILFGILMVTLTYFISRDPRWKSTSSGFLVAGRNVSWRVGAPSIAASWIWAPALFVSVQKSYELGLPGIFWFTVPNIFALIIFAFLAPKIRRALPGGFTLPDWIKYKLNDDRVHKVYMIPYIWYQVMAITVQLYVGGMMLNYLTGINLNVLMLLMLIIGLSYSLISGLRASIATDMIQMVFIILGMLIVIPWVVIKAGSGAISEGLGGMAQNTNIFDPQVAFSFGIVTSIGLIAGAISDQQYWQRSFAVKEKDLVKSFVIGGLLFGLVPIVLSLLGFIAAVPELGISLPEGTGLPMIGIATVATLLPKAAVVFFVVMLLGGLLSTLDSGLCAASSLYAVDLAPKSEEEASVILKGKLGEALSEEEESVQHTIDIKTTRRARQAMYYMAGIGLIFAFIVQNIFALDQLWWLFNGVATCFVVPTIMSLYYKSLSAKGVLWGIIGSSLGMIAFVYGNWVHSDVITVVSAIFIVGISIIMNIVFRIKE